MWLLDGEGFVFLLLSRGDLPLSFLFALIVGYGERRHGMAFLVWLESALCVLLCIRQDDGTSSTCILSFLFCLHIFDTPALSE